jgi:hypothetical protein
MNRKEYRNAVRDLLAVDFDATEVLPADDVAEGFDNIATALQVSPSFIEQYVIAARAVAVKAMGRPDARPGGWTFRAGSGTQLTHVPGCRSARAAASWPTSISRPTASTSSTSPTWPPTSGATGWSSRTRCGDRRQQGRLRDGDRRRRGHEGLRPGAERRAWIASTPPQEHPLRATRGRTDRRDLQAPHLRRVGRSAADVRAGGGQDRFYRVQLVPVRARSIAKGSAPRRAAIGSSSASRRLARRRGARRVCARQIIGAWRAAPTGGRRPEDVERAVRSTTRTASRTAASRASAAPSTGVLASPFFSIAASTCPRAPPGAPTRSAISSWRRSLSFFLWNTIPDDELLQLAVDGKL